MLASAGVRNLRVNCGYSMSEEPHWGQRSGVPISGSDFSHSTIKLCAFSKSFSSTFTFTFACGLDMKATRCRCPSPMMSALTPTCCNRSRKCFALDCSLKVAIVTIIIGRGPPQFSKQHSLQLRKIGRRKPFVEHQINEHAGNGDIEPDGHCPFGNTPMSIPPPAEHRDKSEDDERQGHKGKQNVGDQHGEVDRSNPAARAEMGRTFTGIIMVNEITGEKCA